MVTFPSISSREVALFKFKSAFVIVEQINSCKLLLIMTTFKRHMPVCNIICKYRCFVSRCLVPGNAKGSQKADFLYPIQLIMRTVKRNICVHVLHKSTDIVEIS